MSDDSSQSDPNREDGAAAPPRHDRRPDIRVLPDSVIDQIAAGEVVERPASVVKELLENALDAGATHVTTEVEEGGKALIRVLDNGCGMTEAEARLALRRHATSKLRALDDIYALDTMGFRGEALPSIAAVSRMTLITRVRDQVAGTRFDIEAGRIVSVSEVGAPAGTQIEVQALLHNVPARLKFLKGNATEASHVSDVVNKLAMAHPYVHVRLKHGKRTAIDVPMHKSRLERVRALLGSRMGRRIHRVSGIENDIEVDAYLSAPELAQTTTRGVQLFVGRRPVKDRGLLHAIQMGYGELVPKGRYPVVVLFVDTPRSDVDVNVHPQKLEVRFSDAQRVYAAVRHVIRRGVGEAPWLDDGPEPGMAPVRMHAVAASRPPHSAADDRVLSGKRGATNLAAGHAAEATRNLFDKLGRPVRTEPASSPPDEARPASAGPAHRTDFPLADHRPEDARAEGEERASWDDPPSRKSPWQYSGPGPRSKRHVVSTPVAQRDETSSSPSDEPARAPVPGVDAPYPRVDAHPSRAAEPERTASSGSVAAEPEYEPSAADFFARLSYIGQLDRTYLLCETDGELILVDQHAAHERVAFQRLRERFRKRDIPVQRMLFPLEVELSSERAAVVEDSAEELALMGFELTHENDDTYSIQAIPAGLRPGDAKPVLLELLAELAERGGSSALDDRLDLALATIACHSVVRAGDVLSTTEVEALFRSMDQVDFKAHCPHGRPVLLRISIGEIARRFGRT